VNVTKSAIAILIILLLLLQYKLWLGSGNLIEVSRLKEAIEQQKQENARLMERNHALEAEVLDLKKGMAAVEERARKELGMIKKGETFYQIVDEDELPKPNEKNE
jgi:cell division protein FtsB